MKGNKKVNQLPVIGTVRDIIAQKVAEADYSIAKNMNAEVTLLHVLSDPVYFKMCELCNFLSK